MTRALETEPCPHGTAGNPQVGIVNPILDHRGMRERRSITSCTRYRTEPVVKTQYLKMFLQKQKKKRMSH
jgi:hypothetical protein